MIHRALETLLEREESRVHGVLQLELVVIPLLEERLRIDHVLANYGRPAGGRDERKAGGAG